jgi:ribonuclease R
VDPERLLAVLRKKPDQALSLTQLLNDAGVPERKEKDAKRTLKGLVRDGVVERERGRRYRLSRAGEPIEGRVEVDRRGRAHVVPEGKKGKPKSGPLPLLYESDQAPQHNDRVRAEVVQLGRQRRHFARLRQILERPAIRHLGVLRKEVDAWIVHLEVSPNAPAGLETKPIRDVLIPPDDVGKGDDGDLVEVEFEPSGSAKKAPLGRVLQVLGKPGDRPTEIEKLLIEHGLDRPFPAAVIREAEAYGNEPSQADREGRRDVRDLPLVTIDGETAKDFDDAVCAKKEGRNYRLYVAIADVSHYVRMGSALDDEAFRRGTSTYLTDRAIPMLPEALSNGLCSLNPSVDRLCMLAELLIDPTGRVRDASFHRAVMRSHARLTYTRVAKALDGEPDEECQRLLPTLLVLAQVSRKLLERRLRRGSLDLDLPEPQIVFDDEGRPVDTVRRPRNEAHRIIEDLMIAANEAVARHFEEKEEPCMYRVHEKPDSEKLANFVKLCESLGVSARVSDDPSPAEVSKLLLDISEHPNGRALHTLLLRSLAQARYAGENLGHFGLASSAYLHFTSPIRRYPDLIVHRLLKQMLDGAKPWYSEGRLDEMAGTCSDAERKAMLAERASLELDRALVANEHLGEKLPATVTGIQGFGLFAAVVEPFIEGLIPVQTLPSDYYQPDEFGSRLVGVNTGRTFALGDSIEVEIENVDIAKRQVQLGLVDESLPEKTERASRPRRRDRPGARPRDRGPRAESRSKPRRKRSRR